MTTPTSKPEPTPQQPAPAPVAADDAGPDAIRIASDTDVAAVMDMVNAEGRDVDSWAFVAPTRRIIRALLNRLKRAEAQQPPAGQPNEWFADDAEGERHYFATPDQARDCADTCLAHCLENGEWCDEANDVCWGAVTVLGKAEQSEEEGNVHYAIRDTPAPVAATDADLDALLDALLALARGLVATAKGADTQGAWAQNDEQGTWIDEADGGEVVADAMDHGDAAHIAACNPAAIQRLGELVERLVARCRQQPAPLDYEVPAADTVARIRLAVDVQADKHSAIPRQPDESDGAFFRRWFGTATIMLGRIAAEFGLDLDDDSNGDLLDVVNEIVDRVRHLHEQMRRRQQPAQRGSEAIRLAALFSRLADALGYDEDAEPDAGEIVEAVEEWARTGKRPEPVTIVAKLPQAQQPAQEAQQK